MKLEKIELNGIEYYQWSKNINGKDCVGDIFRDSKDIQREEIKFNEQWK